MDGHCYIKLYGRKGMTYKDICERYIDCVQKHYEQNCSVVFDRYSGNASTKDPTHPRWSKVKLDRPVLFTESTVFNME